MKIFFTPAGEEEREISFPELERISQITGTDTIIELAYIDEEHNMHFEEVCYGMYF